MNMHRIILIYVLINCLVMCANSFWFSDLRSRFGSIDKDMLYNLDPSELDVQTLLQDTVSVLKYHFIKKIPMLKYTVLFLFEASPAF